MENFICAKCGALVYEDDLFCSKCGAYIEALEDVNQNSCCKTKTVNKRKGLTIICIIVAICIVFCIVLLYGDKMLQNNVANPTHPTGVADVKNSINSKYEITLPDLYEFETLMTKAIIDVFDDLEVNAIENDYLLKEYNIRDFLDTEASYDHMVSCTYANNAVNLVGLSKDDKIDCVFTFVSWPDKKFDAEKLVKFAPFVMIPAGLFNDKYSNYDELYTLFTELVQTGIQREYSKVLVIDDIEYTLTVSDAMMGFKVNDKGEEDFFDFSNSEEMFDFENIENSAVTMEDELTIDESNGLEQSQNITMVPLNYTSPEVNPESLRAFEEYRAYYNGTIELFERISDVQLNGEKYYHYIYKQGAGPDFYVKASEPYSIYLYMSSFELVWENGPKLD